MRAVPAGRRGLRVGHGAGGWDGFVSGTSDSWHRGGDSVGVVLLCGSALTETDLPVEDAGLERLRPCRGRAGVGIWVRAS